MKGLDIEEWLITRFSNELGIDPVEIGIDTPFSSLSLDSIILVSIADELDARIEREIDASIFWEFDNIRELLKWLKS